VLVVNNATLSDTIEIIGSPADVLIISDNGSSIACNSCDFKNINRLTFATTTYTDSETIGALTTTNGGQISINHLTAAGIQSLELISQSINLSGVIDTNIKADIHPEGGLIISDNGTKVIGSGGVNVYSGALNIHYDSLSINSIANSSTPTLSANINAASIAITSANHITIPNNVRLNTTNDALSTSPRNDTLYAPLEGIFLTTLKNQAADININGLLITDNAISLKSYDTITLNASSNIISKNLEFLARRTIVNKGLIQTTDLTASATNYINNGNISTNNMTVDVDQNIFNSYGGIITARKVILKARNGYVTNGSRTNKINYNLSILPLSVDSTATNWGIYRDVSTVGTITSNLSAHILANEIEIQARQFENINPYVLNKSTTDNWDSGIIVDNHKASQVSIQAENTLNIKASTYILNASAIIGLNQENGVFNVNTAKLSNERYKLITGLFNYNQLILSDDRVRENDTFNSGTTTNITSYSPPGRLFSFGEFKFGDGVADNTKANFINEFSYFEVFKDARFHESSIKTIGLELGYAFASNQLGAVRNCLVYQRCQYATYTTTNAEAETLFSIRGDLLGIDPTLPTSDLEVANADAISAHQQILIDEFVANYNYVLHGPYIEGHYGYVRNITVDGDTLSFRATSCTNPASCGTRTITQSISALVNAAAENINNDVTVTETNSNGTTTVTYTNEQLEAAANVHIKTLPRQNTNLIRDYVHRGRDSTVITISVDRNTNEVSILYNEAYTYYYSSYGGAYWKDDYVSVGVIVPLSTLTPLIP
jgi:hypothetical protein